MRDVLAHKAARLALTAMVVGAGIAAGLVGPRSASADIPDASGLGAVTAEIDLCQSDPIITMTRADGSTTQLNIESSIHTAPKNVRGVYYKVQIPSTVKSWSIAYPPGDLPQSREHVKVTATSRNGQYVSTISVDASVRASVVGSAWTDSNLVSRAGSTHQTIRLRLAAS
jgi:hypothetical protein